jgi:hypothetical protein
MRFFIRDPPQILRFYVLYFKFNSLLNEAARAAVSYGSFCLKFIIR